jgi:hypothetical protein
VARDWEEWREIVLEDKVHNWLYAWGGGGGDSDDDEGVQEEEE